MDTLCAVAPQRGARHVCVDDDVADAAAHETRPSCDEEAPRKRMRSIYRTSDYDDDLDSDVDEDDRVHCYEAGVDEQQHTSGDVDADNDSDASLHPACTHMYADGWSVPATPLPAQPLLPGACMVTPGFRPMAAADIRPAERGSRPEAASSGTSCSYVAAAEEANRTFRPYMEDRWAQLERDGVLYLGCFDGHGGQDASCFLQANLLPAILEQLQPGRDVLSALQTAYLDTNAAFRCTGSGHGSTATTVIVSGSRLICANVGDSPAFLIMKNGDVYSLIHEHKLEGAELQRVIALGMPLYRNPAGPTYMGTTDGTRWLNMSRAFGDFSYLPAILCEPHVSTMDATDAKYLVIGSDGLTEKWSVADAAAYVMQLSRAGYGLQEICRRLIARAVFRGSTDNVTCVVADLEEYAAHCRRQQQQCGQEQGVEAASVDAGFCSERPGLAPTGEDMPPAALHKLQGSGEQATEAAVAQPVHMQGDCIVAWQDASVAQRVRAIGVQLGAAAMDVNTVARHEPVGSADSPLSDDTGEELL